MENVRYKIFYKLTKNKRNEMFRIVNDNVSNILIDEIDIETFTHVKKQTNVLDMDHRTLIKKLGFINIEMEQDRSMFYGKGKLVI
jgi:hypothetical protein